MNMAKNLVKTFGGSGREAGCFSDPAGIAVDDRGFMIIADSRNHRLQVGSQMQFKKPQYI